MTSIYSLTLHGRGLYDRVQLFDKLITHEWERW